ncbi:glycosyltransferase family 2 protein [Alteromonas antoniana]|uniref:glycosyltransferase family 2 protein n=1 Tax=Alteromonas antoniana TaxID=2803813 RepID=UPI001C4475CF|nr:glycosyltransferase family 2 protein [Alteromonas antoniana]
MSIGAVIILYHPDKEHVTRMINELASGELRVTVVDNSPAKTTLPDVASHHYLFCGGNVGIAEAQNRGIEDCLKAGCSEVLILDQDSKISLSIVRRLHEHLQTITETERCVAAVGPMLICEFSNKQVKPKLQKALAIKDNLSEVRQIIASGMLIPAAAFKHIGPKESALFIDGVDHEWCWRARKKGYKVYQALDVGMPHRQGDARHKICGLEFKQGSPVRLYYQVRNVLILSRRSYVPFYWKCRHLLALPLRWGVNRWHFSDGQARGRYFVKGLVDGLRGKTGKLG